MTNFEKIGTVKNRFNESTPPKEIKKEASFLEIEEKYAEGLFKIEDSQYIDVVFYFDRSPAYKLKGPVFTGEVKGVFASRSPKRPNGIGVTTVKIIERQGNKIKVIGLDALNNTPILDIKPIDNSLFENEYEKKERDQDILKSNPAFYKMSHIRAGETDELLIKAAQMHGHYCPGLAMGVMAATYTMQKMLTFSDGMEDLLAITETNNCFSDGIQFVTGCSFGNNALIFKDIGKTAFTLTKRDGKGIRLFSRDESRDEIRKAFPEFTDAFDRVVKNKDHSDEAIAQYKQYGIKRAFKTLEIPIEKLFKIEEKTVEIPKYAPSYESVKCKICNESVMASRINEDKICMDCRGKDYFQLDGHGMRIV